MTRLTTADRIGMYVGGGLVVLGVVVIGLLEMLLGTGHPVGSDGQIEHEAFVPLEIRSYIILAGLVTWGLLALYRAASTGSRGRTSEAGERLAD